MNRNERVAHTLVHELVSLEKHTHPHPHERVRHAATPHVHRLVRTRRSRESGECMKTHCGDTQQSSAHELVREWCASRAPCGRGHVSSLAQAASCVGGWWSTQTYRLSSFPPTPVISSVARTDRSLTQDETAPIPRARGISRTMLCTRDPARAEDADVTDEPGEPSCAEGPATATDAAGSRVLLTHQPAARIAARTGRTGG